MADNTQLSAAVGSGDTLATDDISGVKYPRSKIVIGADGTNDGDVSSANPLPVTGTLTAVTSITNTVTVDGSGVTQPVSGTVTANLSATDNAVLDSIDTAVNGTLTVGSHAVTNAGTFAVQVDGSALTALQTIDDPVTTISSTDVMRVAIFDASDTQITSFGGGTQYAVDAALGSTPTGTLAVGIRDDALSSLTPVEGDAVGLRVDANGALWTKPSGVVSVDDNSGSLTIDNADITTIAGAVSGSEMQVDVVGSLPSGSATIGSINTVFTCNTLTGSGVAHGSADSGNPHKMGAKAVTSITDQTLVDDDDRTDLYAGEDGVLITRPHCHLADVVSEVDTNTDGASTAFASGLAAPGAGIRIYLTKATISNSSSSFRTVDIRDGAAGAVLWTLPVPAEGGVTHTFEPPIPLTANTAVAYDASAATTTLTIAVAGFTSKV